VLKRQPAIEFPDSLSLGEHEIGEQVTHPFTIANRGGAELVIDEITSNCSCSGMERDDNGSYSRLQSLHLKPGEESQLVIRVRIGPVPIGTSMRNVVEFRTNDPRVPLGRIEAIVRRVSGGVTTTPESVVFGIVPVGASVRQIVQVWDKSVTPRKIDRLETNNPDRISIRVLAEDDKTPETSANVNGRVIDSFEVTVKTDEPCQVNATIEIHLAGETRNPDIMKVYGTIAPPFQLSPSLITLPRASAAGELYSARCICRSTKGKPVTIKVDGGAPGLIAQVSDGPQADAKLVQITWDQEKLAFSGDSQREVIRFLVRDDDSEAIVELPVILRKRD
jgi:hypothetical protein